MGMAGRNRKMIAGLLAASSSVGVSGSGNGASNNGEITGSAFYSSITPNVSAGVPCFSASISSTSNNSNDLTEIPLLIEWVLATVGICSVWIYRGKNETIFKLVLNITESGMIMSGTVVGVSEKELARRCWERIIVVVGAVAPQRARLPRLWPFTMAPRWSATLPQTTTILWRWEPSVTRTWSPLTTAHRAVWALVEAPNSLCTVPSAPPCWSTTPAVLLSRPLLNPPRPFEDASWMTSPHGWASHLPFFDVPSPLIPSSDLDHTPVSLTTLPSLHTTLSDAPLFSSTLTPPP